MARPSKVSIPYLRVTHTCTYLHRLLSCEVSIPYLRVTHAGLPGYIPSLFKFQSPIYGSRTIRRSRRFTANSSFNPLSTGHAPKPYVLSEMPFSLFQSPIYGSRTRIEIEALDLRRVSIPYLRVTHKNGEMPAGKTLPSFNPLSTGHAREEDIW